MQIANILSPVERQLLQNALQNDLTMLHRRRIQIMLLADTGQPQSKISQLLQCSAETVRYWTSMASSGKAHTWKDYPVGRPKTVNEQYLKRLKELVSHSPREYGYSFHRWTVQWLGKHLAHELGIEVGDRSINKLLKKMGLSTRIQHEEIPLEVGITVPKRENCTLRLKSLIEKGFSNTYFLDSQMNLGSVFEELEQRTT